jgi:hypothetical protein
MDVNYNNALNVLKKLNAEYFGEIDQESQLNSIEISISNELFIHMESIIFTRISKYDSLCLEIFRINGKRFFIQECEANLFPE